MMSFRKGAAYARALAEDRPAVALITGGRSGIGLALAKRIATFPFIDKVLAVSRSIKDSDVSEISPKVQALQADVSTEEGRQAIVNQVSQLCGNKEKQLRFLIHNAGTIDPIKNILKVTPEELRNAMNVNVESPFFLTTALYRFMEPLEGGLPGRVLHVSSGAAHGPPPSGWGCYGISKAAFFQSYRILAKDFQELGGKVIVGSFKPGVVDTPMQKSIRGSGTESMPMVDKFKDMKKRAAENISAPDGPRPPPEGALDSPDNVAWFVEFLLLGTNDDEFINEGPGDYDIRDKELFSKWIPPENLKSN